MPYYLLRYKQTKVEYGQYVVEAENKEAATQLGDNVEFMWVAEPNECIEPEIYLVEAISSQMVLAAVRDFHEPIAAE